MKLRRAYGYDYQHTPAIKLAVEIAEKPHSFRMRRFHKVKKPIHLLQKP